MLPVYALNPPTRNYHEDDHGTIFNICSRDNDTSQQLLSPLPPPPPIPSVSHLAMSRPWLNYYHNLYINWYKLAFSGNLNANPIMDTRQLQRKPFCTLPLYNNHLNSNKLLLLPRNENHESSVEQQHYKDGINSKEKNSVVPNFCSNNAPKNNITEIDKLQSLYNNLNSIETKFLNIDKISRENNFKFNNYGTNPNRFTNSSTYSNYEKQQKNSEINQVKKTNSTKLVNWMLPEPNDDDSANKSPPPQQQPNTSFTYLQSAKPFQSVVSTMTQATLMSANDNNNFHLDKYFYKQTYAPSENSSTEVENNLFPSSSIGCPYFSENSIPGESLSPAVESPFKNFPKHSPPPRFQCDACNKSYSTYNGLSKHKEFHCSRYVKKQFTCPHCECKSYASLGALKMHIRTHTLPCRCKLCGKAFSRPWLLQGHLRTHTGERPFSCPHCNRAFADRSNLRAHMQTHSDIKKYNCNNCGKSFSRMSLLHKHKENNAC